MQLGVLEGGPCDWEKGSGAVTFPVGFGDFGPAPETREHPTSLYRSGFPSPALLLWIGLLLSISSPDPATGLSSSKHMPTGGKYLYFVVLIRSHCDAFPFALLYFNSRPS